MRGQRVPGDVGDHIADHEIGVDLVAFDDGLRGGDELVVERFELLLVVNLELGELAAVGAGKVVRMDVAEAVERAQSRLHDRDVDLVEGQPVFDLVLVALEAGRRVFYEEVDDAPVGEAAVLRDDGPGYLIVAERDERLDAVLLALVEDGVVEGETFLVRLRIVAVRENAAPVDGETEAFEAHLAEEGDVFLVVMIKIDRLMRRVECIRLYLRAECSRCVDVAAQEHIRNGKSLPVFKIGALTLVRGRRAAP